MQAKRVKLVINRMADTDALLHASGLTTLLSLASTSSSCYVLPQPTPVRANTRPIQLMAAIAPGEEADRFRSLWKLVKQRQPNAVCFVRPVQVCTSGAHNAPQFSDGAGEHAAKVCKMLRLSHTRCLGQSSAAASLPSADEMQLLAAALFDAVSHVGGLASHDDARLLVSCVLERWVQAGAQAGVPAVEHDSCLVIEGFAPAHLRDVIEAAAERHLALHPAMAALGPLEISCVSWHASPSQAALCALRWQRARSHGATPPRDSPTWLDAMERMCAHTPGGLLRVLHGTPTAEVTPQPPSHSWRAGHAVLSYSGPRIDVYPTFLSPSECDHLLTLALAHAEPMAAAGAAAGGYASSASDKMRAVLPVDDPTGIVDVVEGRCAEATGVPCHADERAVELKLTNEEDAPPVGDEGAWNAMPSLHVDTNNGGVYRCATVIIYLSDLPTGMGGETRFPVALAPAESRVRAAAEAALRAGATVLRRGASAEATALLEAAEMQDVGVSVRPRRGSACVFWTMDGAGVDPASWHNGAKVLHGAGGKIIAQKFKELPAQYRGATPLSLPAECAVPNLSQRGRSAPNIG